MSFSFLQTPFVRHPSRTRHNGDKGADVQQGPAQRFLFRLSPCVNLIYCLLLLTHPMGTTPTEDTALLAFRHDRLTHVPGNTRFIIKGVTQPSICYKVRIPSGVFGIASLALYASALNHVFGKMLGLPGSWVCRLTFRFYRLRQPKENYCDCALVIPDKHLSRESRKLTVMI